MKTPLPLVLATLLVVSGGTAELSAQSITLDFGWTPGVATVTATSNMAAGVMGQSTEIDSSTGYRLTVTEDGGGLRLSYSDFTFNGSTIEDLLTEAGQGEGASEMMANMQPDILVDGMGQFRSLADYTALRESMEAMMAKTRAELEAQGMAEMFDEMMEASMSEEAMSRNAKLAWDQMVGFWAGRTLRVGETVSVASEMVVPMMPGEPVTVDTELELVGRVPCVDGEAADSCLELVSRASPDGEELRNLMDIFIAGMMEQYGGTGMEMGITEMSLATHNTLVVEAETLRPLRMESQVDMTMGMDMMGMTQRIQNRQLVETRFSWEPP